MRRWRPSRTRCAPRAAGRTSSRAAGRTVSARSATSTARSRSSSSPVERQLVVTTVVHATGSAGTQAGLVAGFEGMSSGIDVLGIGVRAPREAQEANVYRLACETADRLGMPGAVRRERVVANCDYVGDGYGKPTTGNGRGRLAARAAGRAAARPRLHRQGDGRADRPDPARPLPTGRQRRVRAYRGRAGLFGYLPAFDGVLASATDTRVAG